MCFYINMNLTQNSFNSEAESPVRRSGNLLCSQLTDDEVKWNNSLQGSHRSIKDDEDENFTISPNLNHQLAHQPELSLQNSLEDIEVEQFSEKGSDQPKTITLIEDIVSKESIQGISKVSQFSSQVDNQCYATFLNLLESNYIPMIKGFQILFENLSNLFGVRIKEIQNTYLEFLRIKSYQQEVNQTSNIGKVPNPINKTLYADCKIYSDRILSNLKSKKNSKKDYVSTLCALYKQIKGQLEKQKQGAKQKENVIRKIHDKLNQISEQMVNLMVTKKRKDQKLKLKLKEELLGTNYVRTKYLMNKQKTYLNCIASFLEKVTLYVSYICLDVQPKLCLKVKQALLSYLEISSQSNPQLRTNLLDKLENLEKAKCYENIFNEIQNLLQLCIPSTLQIKSRKIKGQNYLHQLIEDLIRESQNLIYIPVIEINVKDYVYCSQEKCDVFWKKVDLNQKVSGNQENQIEAKVVVTCEGFLILELMESNNEEQKMAILKLSKVKLSRKKNEVIITDKGSGVLGSLLSTNNILGSLVFQSFDDENQNADLVDIEEFISKVREVLENRKNNAKK